jgi:acyl dehydratase
MRAFEDFSPGEIIVLRDYKVEAEEMVEFALRYDPQYFHADPIAAATSPFGGLIASGWLTAAIFMRMQCDSFMIDSTCVGSPGVDEIRWLHPVRPGDTLRGTNQVLEARPSKHKPDRGVVFSKVEICNQDTVPVMSLVTRAIYLNRGVKLQTGEGSA